MNARPQLGLAGRSPRPGAQVRGVCQAASLLLAVAACFGCARDSPPATVEGTVRLDGEPLDNCLISFLPEPGQEVRRPHSTGLTDRHGSYRLRCDNQQRGAAIGWHRVTVQDLSVSSGVRRRDHGAVDLEMEETAPPPPVRPSRVPKPYTSASDTPLRKEVKPGHQVIDLDIE